MLSIRSEMSHYRVQNIRFSHVWTKNSNRGYRDSSQFEMFNGDCYKSHKRVRSDPLWL